MPNNAGNWILVALVLGTVPVPRHGINGLSDRTGDQLAATAPVITGAKLWPAFKGVGGAFAAALPDQHSAAKERAPAAAAATAQSQRRHTQTEPLERELASLRQRLQQVHAAVGLLLQRDGGGDHTWAGAGVGGGAGAGPGVAPPGGRDGLLSRLRSEEQQLRLAIAVALQQLNHLRPDGGSRLPEAEAHYRAVLASLEAHAASRAGPAGGPLQGPDRRAAPSPSAAAASAAESDAPLLGGLGVRSNLAALLLEAERPAEALRELQAALEQADGLLGGAAAVRGLLCGLRFNRGKALAALGRTSEADAAYAEAAAGAVGLEPGCFAKATAAMSRLPDELLSHVTAALRTAEESGLRERLLRGGAAATDPTAAAASAAPQPDTAASSGTAASGRHFAGEASGADGGGGGGPAGAQSLPGSPGGGGDPLVDRSSGSWLAGLGPGELGWLYFAAAKALEERGAGAEEAWGALVKANELHSALQPYDPGHDWRQLATITSVFSRPLLAAVAGSGAGLDDETPVFVVGLPRSGSTLVETMLASHPDVWGAGEDTALAPLTPELNNLLATHGLTQLHRLAELGRRYVEEMRRRAVAAGWPPDRPPRRIVDKMLRNLWLLGHISLLLPRARLVLVTRHPLDTALSCYGQPFGYAGVPWAWRLEHIGQQVRMAAALAAHWRAVLPPGRLLTLHYEEVVAAPEASARRLLSHCGLSWQPGVLSFHTANRTVATASVAQVRQPLYNRSVGRWRKYEAQLAPLAAALRPEIQSYEAALAAALSEAEAAQARLDRLAAAADGAARGAFQGAGGSGGGAAGGVAEGAGRSAAGKAERAAQRETALVHRRAGDEL